MTLVDVLRLLRRNALVLIISVLVGIGGAAGYSMLQPVVYQAASKGYLVVGKGASTTVNEQLNANSLASLRMQQYLPLVGTQAVADNMAEEMQLDGRGFSPGPIEVENVGGSGILQITARGASAEEAQARADAGVRALASEILRLETLDASKIKESETLDDAATGGEASLTLVPYEPAGLPGKPVSPDWVKNLLIGAGIGLLLGLILAYLRKMFDLRVRTTSDVEEAAETAVLAVIPTSSELAKQRKTAGGLERSSLSSEALRQLRSNIRFLNVDDPPRSIVITSSTPGEGKSTVSANLARVLAEAGEHVVLIDADLRRPMVATQFGIDGKIGLTQVLAGRVSLTDALQPTETKRLQVLPAGRIPPNPSELVGSKQMTEVVKKLRQNHMVIVDAPPILPVTDAGILSRQCDGAILVVRVGKTMKDEVKLSAKRLEQVQGKLLGAVINMANQRNMGEVVYGYGYGYGSKGYMSEYYASNAEPSDEVIEPELGESRPSPGSQRIIDESKSAETTQFARVADAAPRTQKPAGEVSRAAERPAHAPAPEPVPQPTPSRGDSGWRREAPALDNDDDGLRTLFGPNPDAR